MKTYKVTITGKLQKEIEIEASSRYEAERLVEKNWNNSEYILDSDSFKGVKFKADFPQNREYER